MPPVDDDEVITIGSSDADDGDEKTPRIGPARERPEVLAPGGGPEITGGQYLFDTIVEVLAPLGLDARLRVVAALDDGDWSKTTPEVRKIFEDVDELYFEEDDEDGEPE